MKQQRLRWMRLDNAAKIYPASKRHNWNNVFRLSATLREPVDPAVLQRALEATIPRFPSIAVRLRRGVFWYYLEEIPQAPAVQPEHAWPLTRMPFDDIRTCAFRVLYDRNRIAVEFFHALTDGNGGLIFLKTLAAEYLCQRYGVRISNDNGVLDRTAPPTEEELEDSFLRTRSLVKASRREEAAYRLRGTRERDGYLTVVTGILNTDEVLQLAKSFGVSLTVLLASALMMAIIKIQNETVPSRRRQKPVKVLIPVNLRKLFPSESLRNYVLYVTPGVDPKLGDYTFEEVLKTVYHQMGVELTSKKLAAKVQANVEAEQHLALRLMPLFLKNIAMKLVYDAVGERNSCLTLSNLGAVTLPEEMRPYVARLDFVLGVQATRPNNLGVLSYGDKLYCNFIRKIEEPTLEREFFQFLRGLGLSVKVESNQR